TSVSWSRRGSSSRGRAAPCGPARSARAGWGKSRPGSDGIARSGTDASANRARVAGHWNRRRKATDGRREREAAPVKNGTTVERKSERELVVTRTFNGPARIVFEAWTRPELFKQWWAPKSMGMVLRSCEMDVRVGGTYRLVFGHDASHPDEFFGRYI